MNAIIPPLVAVGVFFGISSADAQIAVVGDLSNDRLTVPGEQYEGIISVHNDTQVPQEAKVYQRDYTFQADGTNIYGEPGSHPRSNARWITFTPARLVIPPGGTTDVYFTVNVPIDTSGAISGSFWSMLMVEGIPDDSPESSLHPIGAPPDMGVRQTIRYGIQIASHIQNTARKDMKLVDPKVISSGDEGYMLQVDIENTGNAWMRPEVYVDLFDAQGVKTGRYSGNRYRIYPGTSVRQNIPLTSVRPGTYKALVVIDDGGSDIFGAQYTLQF